MYHENAPQHWFAAWLKRTDLLVLVAVLTVVAGTWAFVEIADEVTEGDAQEIDRWVVLSLRDPADPAKPIGPWWLKETARDVTALGGYAVLILVIVVVGGFLLLARKYHALIFVLSASIGGWLLSVLLKEIFARPRPELVPHLTEVGSPSFPSGHSMLSAVVYLTLGSLSARLVESRRLKVYFIVVALLIAFLVGMTRVYLGVHYPTDVLAGWTAGLVWAVACWLAARFLQNRGMIERDSDSVEQT